MYADKPGAPENPQVSDVYAEHCKLSWNPPTDDGGSEVTGRRRIVVLHALFNELKIASSPLKYGRRLVSR